MNDSLVALLNEAIAGVVTRTPTGAVVFAPPEEVDEAIGRPGTVTWLTNDEVADRLRDLKKDSTAWLGQSFTGQFSLAGAQAKTALLYQDGNWGVPHGAAATTHILKPAIAGLDDHDLNEHLCQALEFPPSKRYQNEGGPGPVQIVSLLRRVMSPQHADVSITRFFDALAWNWIIGGTDAHAKITLCFYPEGKYGWPRYTTLHRHFRMARTRTNCD
jgi:serine/threonine-protein kinase HipA